MRSLSDRSQPLRSGTRPIWSETEDREGYKRKPGSHQSDQRRTDSRNRLNRNLTLDASLHQLQPGVGHAGRTRVGDKGYAVASAKSPEKARKSRPGVVLMKADSSGLN